MQGSISVFLSLVACRFQQANLAVFIKAIKDDLIHLFLLHSLLFSLFESNRIS